MRTVVIAVLCAVGGIVVGRLSSAADSVVHASAAPDPLPASSLASVRALSNRVHADAGRAAALVKSAPSDPASIDVANPNPVPRCEEQLASLQGAVRADEEERLGERGTVIPTSSRTPGLRFQQPALTAAMTAAFPDAHVPGRLDGIDCSEFPCILFGRIAGTEDEMEKLEHARSLAPYDDDISSILLWTVSDDEARDKDAHAEEELYAIAFYTRDDQQALGDNLDRRIRARVGDLWNTMRPSDETAARR
jgi:hypothetical protein